MLDWNSSQCGFFFKNENTHCIIIIIITLASYDRRLSSESRMDIISEQKCMIKHFASLRYSRSACRIVISNPVNTQPLLEPVRSLAPDWLEVIRLRPSKVLVCLCPNWIRPWRQRIQHACLPILVTVYYTNCGIIDLLSVSVLIISKMVFIITLLCYYVCSCILLCSSSPP